MSRILIIDDDPTVRLSAELVLSALGFDAETADNGRDGLARMRELLPDLVICDIMMPGLDGYEVLAAAQQDARLARIPFIFLTSLSDRAAQRKGMTAGADDYLTKPFQPAEMVDAIQARLRKVLAMGPDAAAVDAVLAKVRHLLEGREPEVPRGPAPATAAPGSSPEAPAGGEVRSRLGYWLERLRSLFDINNPGAILYTRDEILAKKQTIHASYLLALLYFRCGDRDRAEAEYAIAHSMLRLSAEPLRMAIRAAEWQGTSHAYRGLRTKFLRLEGKLESLQAAWLS